MLLFLLLYILLGIPLIILLIIIEADTVLRRLWFRWLLAPSAALASGLVCIWLALFDDTDEADPNYSSAWAAWKEAMSAWLLDEELF